MSAHDDSRFNKARLFTGEVEYGFASLGCEHAADQHRVNRLNDRQTEVSSISGAAAGELFRRRDDGDGPAGDGQRY
ncbi:hypothetical protein KQS06HV_200024 [Klebsiella quasipneumoniae subsp. similipneumoniae]|nr:hypothetical protein KQS06HV_200024 [Klebsiella quasipneumoniae subsp. similipneumoniae]